MNACVLLSLLWAVVGTAKVSTTTKARITATNLRMRKRLAAVFPSYAKTCPQTCFKNGGFIGPWVHGSDQDCELEIAAIYVMFLTF